MKTKFLFIRMALYGLCFGALALSGCDDCCPVHSVFTAQLKNGAPVPTTIYLSSAGERYVFDLNCTMPWMVLADLPGSWLDVSPMNDPNGSREVTITVPVNPTGTSRSHTITFLAANGDRLKINVIQEWGASLTLALVSGQDGSYGSVTGSVVGVALGTSVNAIATPAANHVFVKWVASDNRDAPAVSTSANYTITLNTSTTLYAVFNGVGLAVAPIEIGTAAELLALANEVNGGDNKSGKTYKLIADIDLSIYGTGWNGGKGWTPIGVVTPPLYPAFEGQFDGNGHTISNLYIDSGEHFIGLFGRISNGGVKNLGMENVDITGERYCGGVVGEVRNNSTITGCYTTGTIRSVDPVECQVGGVVGALVNTSGITNCYSTAIISGSSNYVGGVVGYINNNVSLLNCYATGAVSSGGNGVGGIVGYIGTLPPAIVENCVALNLSITSETGTGTDFGRVAGSNGGAMDNNWALGNMQAVGVSFSGSSTLSGLDGASITALEARTPAQTQYTNWDFVSPVWKWVSGAYLLPVLNWQTSVPAMPTHL